MTERGFPPRVSAARRTAQEVGFDESRIPEVGRLLRLAATAKPGGAIAESGTGTGVGTAWLHAGLSAGARLVTVERDESLARRAADLFADDSRVTVLFGDWRLLERHAPSTSSSATAAANSTPQTWSSTSSPPADSSSSTTSPPRPTGHPASRARSTNYASATSPIRP